MPWQKMKKTDGQIKVHKTQYRKLKTTQHEPHQNFGVIKCASEGKADPAPHVAPVV